MREHYGAVSALDDAALLERIAQRRTDAFEELYRRHAQAVSSIANHVCRDTHTAEEITQSTFLSLWTRAQALVGRPDGIRSWLVTVARNAALDRLRRQAVRPPVATGDVRDAASHEFDPSVWALEGERRRDIRSALAALSEEQRVVIELAFFAGLTQTEIAGVLNEPLGTVKSRVRLAMRHLRAAFNEHGDVIRR